MDNIQYAVWKKETNNAGGKAKNDAYDIAEKLGFQASYKPSETRIIRVLQQYMSMRKFDSANVVFMQYPAVDFRILPSFLKHIRNKKATIALIHDLRSIQGSGEEENVEEIPLLNNFEYIIAHNQHMADYLIEKGCTSHIINLELFDYLHDASRLIQEPKGDGSIAFAGNLVKSTFINELLQVKNVKFVLYGNKGDKNFAGIKNVEYKGSLPSEEIVYKLEGDYGLVWDGDSVHTCSGKHGEYLRYNNPHKLSLYIAAGKPVITWKKAAIADFVTEHKIGIVVEDLRELSINDLTRNYGEMRSNVIRIKDKVANGYYLEKAISECLAI